MAFTPRTCDRYIDDYPGVRANCESMIANGKRCVGCPDHPDSPERRIAELEGLLREAKPYTLLFVNNEGYKPTALYERIEAALNREGT